jgi:hypothetical protein
MNRISRLLPLLSVLAMGRVSADESPRLLSDPSGYQRRLPQLQHHVLLGGPSYSV